MTNLDGSERVLCVHRSVLADLGVSDRIGAFYPIADADRSGVIDGLLLERSTKFLPRTEELENSHYGSPWLQVVPYVVLACDGKVFAYRRTIQGAEGKLHGFASLGVGGHVNPIDADGREWVLTEQCLLHCAARELSEEAGVYCAPLNFTGILFDPTNLVGDKHLGLVYVATVGDSRVEPEASIEPLGWMTPDEAKGKQWDFWESWSGLLLDRLEHVSTVSV